MIDKLSLLFSIVSVGLIVVRAAMLDRTLPWFKPPPAVLPTFRKKPVQQR